VLIIVVVVISIRAARTWSPVHRHATSLGRSYPSAVVFVARSAALGAIAVLVDSTAMHFLAPGEVPPSARQIPFGAVRGISLVDVPVGSGPVPQLSIATAQNGDVLVQPRRIHGFIAAGYSRPQLETLVVAIGAKLARG
jgi:hypothetical protein